MDFVAEAALTVVVAALPKLPKEAVVELGVGAVWPKGLIWVFGCGAGGCVVAELVVVAPNEKVPLVGAVGAAAVMAVVVAAAPN